MSTNINSLLNSVPKLGAEKANGMVSYQDWKFALMMVLRCAGSWDIIATEKLSTREALKEWEKKAEDVHTAIGLTIDPSQYQYISDAEDGIDAWKRLQKVYEKNSRANRIALMRQFYNAQHDPSRPITDYINSITKVAARLKAIGVKIEDSTVIDVLIMNLDDQWSNMATSLSATMDDLNVVSDVTGSLIDEEGRRKAINDLAANSDQALAARGTGKYFPNKHCFTCGKKGHIARRCPDRKEENMTANVSVDDYAF
jgi:hypothetical protein